MGRGGASAAAQEGLSAGQQSLRGSKEGVSGLTGRPQARI